MTRNEFRAEAQSFRRSLVREIYDDRGMLIPLQSRVVENGALIFTYSASIGYGVARIHGGRAHALASFVLVDLVKSHNVEARRTYLKCARDLAKGVSIPLPR